jgi:signal transduction histidine kinase/ActR/RegA family two-component response regulator
VAGFKDQPIARKALILGLVPTLSAILLVVSLSMLATYVQARASLVQDLATESAIAADNVSAALAFSDHKAAQDTVNAFRAKGNIEAVCVFDASGRLFASFVQSAGACPAEWRPPDSKGSKIEQDQPILLAGSRRVGVVRAIGNFSRLYGWMRRQVLVALGTLVAGIGLSLLVTSQLGRAITNPVLNLARTADRVSKSGDYAMRVPKTTDDELGHLTESFNSMLEQIQRQHETSAVLLEREQEAGRLKDHFLAAVSHELRTPLNAILGWVQIVRTTHPSEQTMERALESLERNAHAQARVIEDLIEISRVVTGKLQLKREIVDLRRVVRAALDVVSPTMNSKGVELSLMLPDRQMPVSGDPDRLQQVVWNLFSNAIKFTPSGGSVTVVLDASASDVVLTVSDTGIGITPEFLPFVFDRFRQADGTLTRAHGGLGLGLAIAKELTELHGGSVTVVSGGKGKGTTFTIRLPRSAAADPAGDVESIPAPASSLSLAGVRALAVDDDPDALEVLTAALAAYGAVVRRAASGAEAIAAWRSEPFDVLVCDLAMPDVDGFAVLRGIQEGATRSTAPIFAIALTAHASQEDRQRSLAAGFRRHVSKPYDLTDLIEAIRTGVAGGGAAAVRP